MRRTAVSARAPQARWALAQENHNNDYVYCRRARAGRLHVMPAKRLRAVRGAQRRHRVLLNSTLDARRLRSSLRKRRSGTIALMDSRFRGNDRFGSSPKTVKPLLKLKRRPEGGAATAAHRLMVPHRSTWFHVHQHGPACVNAAVPLQTKA